MNQYRAHFELSSKTRPDGRRDVLLRISKGRSSKRRMSTGVLVNKKDFNSRAKYGSWIKASETRHQVLNNTLKEILNKAESAPHHLKNNRVDPTLDKVIDFLKGNTNNNSFFKFTEQVIQQLRDAQQVNNYKKYKEFYNKLRLFKENRDLTFSDITVELLINYETFMLKKGNATNTVGKELKVLRAILYRAIRQDLFPQEKNPFFKFTIKAKKTSKDKLNADEIGRIESLDLEKGTGVWHARNYFLFSYYCAGVRFADFCRLKWSNIDNGRLIYTMNKTSTTKSFKLYPAAEAILACYQPKNILLKEFIFPILKSPTSYRDEFDLVNDISAKNALVNKNLKKLADKSEIRTRISFHMARHSFSEIARKKNISIYDISKALGHSSVKITENYLSSFDQESVDDAMSKVFSN